MFFFTYYLWYYIIPYRVRSTYHYKEGGLVMIERLREVMKGFSETLTLDESLRLEKGVEVKTESSNHPDYFIKIINNKSE